MGETDREIFERVTRDVPTMPLKTFPCGDRVVVSDADFMAWMREMAKHSHGTPDLPRSQSLFDTGSIRGIMFISEHSSRRCLTSP